MPQRDTEEYFDMLRRDYKLRIQSDYVKYSIKIYIDPCRDLMRAGGLGQDCCKDANVAGCQHHGDILAGEDLQVAYLQNAHVASCRGTEFENDPNCGTFLEIHRPMQPTVLADVQIDHNSFPNGFQTVFLATHRLCLGPHEVWFVVRTRSGPYVQKIQPFMIVGPTCSAPIGAVAPPKTRASESDIP